MAQYPAHLARTHRLFDGRTVTIRPIRTDDAERTHQFLEGLSGESRYFRFQKWVRAPSDRLVHFLTAIDYDRDMAFVCTFAGGSGEEVVGEARYAKNADASCEFGIAIADAWHNSGIAGLLMETILRNARDRGLKRMEGQVLASNKPMLRFARGLGFEILAVPEDPTIRRIVKPL